MICRCQALGLDGKSRCAPGVGQSTNVKQLVAFDWNWWNGWFSWLNVVFLTEQVFVTCFWFFSLKEGWRGGRGPAPMSIALQHPRHTNLYSWRSDRMHKKHCFSFAQKLQCAVKEEAALLPEVRRKVPTAPCLGAAEESWRQPFCFCAVGQKWESHCVVYRNFKYHV